VRAFSRVSGRLERRRWHRRQSLGTLPSVVKDRTVTEAAFPAGGTGARTAELGLLLVYSRALLPPRAFPIRDSITLGRGELATFLVEDAGVSRVHARITRVGSSLKVEDLGSRNGTCVNGVAVSSDGTIADPKSVIRMGGTLLVVLPDVTPYLEPRASPYTELVGGAALDDIRTRIRTIAGTTTPVLILGETGTGKEVVARTIHEHSGRSGEIIALNCAAVPPDLVDAELFGHSRGAFSGAVSSRPGMFRAANGGTLFLDEIGELPAAIQAKLLRVLETSEVRVVGEDKPTKVDVRVVAATNRNVDEMVASEGFRGDLLYRLSGVRIVLPSLNERREDVPALAVRFAEPLGMRISAAALEQLMLTPWPGNVRELRNEVTAAGAVATDRGSDEITLEDLSAPVAVAVAPSRPVPKSSDESELSARVTDVLTRVSGDVSLAAERLGMSRSLLYETLRRLRINAKSFRKKGSVRR
jgi:transcriptional regulator with AAA-type ATPase domain